MYLFKSREPRGSKHSIALLGGSTINLTDFTRFLFENLTAEEKPSHMLLELSLLVVLLHVWAYVYLLRPAENVIPPAPLMMQVSLVSAPAQKTSATVPAPIIKPNPAPKKPKQKPTLAKKPPVPRKPPLTRPHEPVSESPRSEPEAPRAAAPAPASSQPAPPAPSTPTAAPKTESFTEANYRANYAFNPKPNYPRIARSRGWQGKVLLRVQVSATGTCDKVTVHRSSGHEILDESAMEAVKKWRFIPARRGDNPVASSVVVPILFSLND
ncbi:MAG: energy transducer TonB [Methylosarcina sp.]